MSQIPKITALVITKNEEKFMRDFIISMDFVDEIIVVDSFSTDRTVEIVKEFPKVKLIQRDFDNFSSQKNFAIDQAINDWILFFDGDEVLTPELKSEILDTLKTNNNQHVAYLVYRTTIYMNKEIKYSGWQNDKVVRLFNKNFCKYDGKLVHEKINAKGKVGTLKHKIKHYSYKGFNNIIQKRNLYSGFQAQELYLKGLKPNFYHFFFKPIARFFKHFFLKLGFLDGFRGFIISYVYAYSVFVRYVKLWLLRKNLDVDKTENDFPIDALITWVDGNDENHQKKMLPFLSNKNSINDKKFKTRFQQVNEIEFAVKSIIKFAPFIQNIFIITDEQVPNFLTNYNKNKKSNYPNIIIVDHKEIFEDHLDLLPVFNSISIESLLHKVPNLSEHFIYFNDDFLLINKTKVIDFFIDGLPVIRGKWTLYDDKNMVKIFYNKFLTLIGKTKKTKKFGYKRVQQNSAKLIGFKGKYLRIDHTPMPMRKSVIEQFYKSHPNLEYENVKYRFRNVKQHLIQSLVSHIEIKNNKNIIIKKFQLLFLNSYKYPLFWYKKRINKAHNRGNIIFLCLQSLDKSPKNISSFIFKWLNKIFDFNFDND